MIESDLVASMKRLVVMGCLVAATSMMPAAAHADDPPKIIPEELFAEGRVLMDRGEFDAACGKLAESHRLDPAGGTILLLGLSYERQGRLASAWAALRSARAMARKTGRKDRSDVADEHLNALEPRLGYVTVTLASGASVPGLRVTLDGVELGEAAMGVPFPADAGSHELRASAPGYLPSVMSLLVTEPERAHVELAPLARDLGASPPHRSDIPVVATAILSAAATALTAYWGLRARAAEQERPSVCSASDGACLARAASRESERTTCATLATAAGGIAITAAAAAVILLVTGRARPRDAAANVSLGPGGTALQLRF